MEIEALDGWSWRSPIPSEVAQQHCWLAEAAWRMPKWLALNGPIGWLRTERRELPQPPQERHGMAS